MPALQKCPSAKGPEKQVDALSAGQLVEELHLVETVAIVSLDFYAKQNAMS
jgi:hypothetical protein